MAHKKDKRREEDMTTDERANRHPSKSANYLEEAQGVRDDNLSNDVQPLSNEESEHARNKAREGNSDRV